MRHDNRLITRAACSTYKSALFLTGGAISSDDESRVSASSRFSVLSVVNHRDQDPRSAVVGGLSA